MRYLALFILHLASITVYSQIQSNDKSKSGNTVLCIKGTMKQAWYQHGIDEHIPAIEGIGADFSIIVNPRNKAADFISYAEQYYRSQSKKADTASIRWIDGWDKMTVDQKLKKLEETRINHKANADRSHAENNHNKVQVWLINNSLDSVALQMQDWSYVCILQALSPNGSWLPVEYWKFSSCGNSNWTKRFPPKTANSFVITMPRTGNYSTKLRFKILGLTQFYYSNEFYGRINQCDFVEKDWGVEWGGKPFHFYKLDSMINLSRY